MEQKQPQYIEEAEALLSTPFFTDDADYATVSLESQDIGYKTAIYQRSLRLIAEARRREREISYWQSGKETAGVRELTVKRIGEIAFAFAEETAFLGRQLAITNRIINRAEADWDEITDGLRMDQKEYVADITSMLQRSPHRALATSVCDDEGASVHGATVIAPTGYGKTRLMLASAKLLQPGEPLPAGKRHHPVRLLVLCPSLFIADQNVAAFAEAFPGSSVGRVYDGNLEAGADIVVATNDAFINQFSNGAMAGEPVDAIFIDEVHHLTSPRMREVFVDNWQGHTLGFTATPAYDRIKDVRALLPHSIEKAGVAESIEAGILNGSQILTFHIDNSHYEKLLERYGISPEPYEKYDQDLLRQIVDTAVIEFILPLLNEGRRGIIFCQPGDRSRYARELAERLSNLHHEGWAEQPIRAEAMASAYGNPRDVIDRFHRNELDVVTTVDSGREGLNAEFDFVVVNCNVRSRLRGYQIAGRGTRLSERFPVTVFGQFYSPLLDQSDNKAFSMEQVFGNESFDHGRLAKLPEGAREAYRPHMFDVTKLPDLFGEFLDDIRGMAIGEAFVGADLGRYAAEIPEGMISIFAVAEGLPVSMTYIKNRLRDAGFAWRGRMEADADGKRYLVQYYPPEAKEFLRASVASEEHKDAREIADESGAPVSLVKKVAKLLSFEGARMRKYDQGKHVICYTIQETTAIQEMVAQWPGMNPGDASLTELSRRLRLTKETIWRLSGAEETKLHIFNGEVYLRKQEIQEVHRQLETTPMAQDGELYAAALIDAIGMTWQFIEKRLTAEERAAPQLKRYVSKSGAIREALHWPADMSAAIIERLEKAKPQLVPAHLLPMSALRKLISGFSAHSRIEIDEIIDESAAECRAFQLPGSSKKTHCIDWSGVEYLIEHFGQKKGSPSIDFSRLPKSEGDMTPDTIHYAQSLQRLLISAEYLVQY